MNEHKIEMKHGQDFRVVKADYFQIDGGWMTFFRKPPEGGPGREYWRVLIDSVVSMETKKV